MTDAVSKDLAGIVEEEIGEIAAQRKVLLDYSSYEAQRAGAHTGRDGA